MWRNIQAYHRPSSLEQAFALQAEIPAARYVAGGTDLFVQQKKAGAPTTEVISLRSVPELKGVTVDDDTGRTRIGAGVTIAELLADPAAAQYSVLTQAATMLGSPQIRNVATVGGNLCNASPCADTAPPLLVLEASVEILGAGGKQRELTLERFFSGPGETALEPGEILGAVLLGRPNENASGLFLKKRRVRMDLALVSVAVLVEADGRWCEKTRVAAGSVAPTPIRLRAVEELLEGNEISDRRLVDAEHLARECIAPITDLRTTEDYRHQLTGVYVRRALEQLFAQEAA